MPGQVFVVGWIDHLEIDGRDRVEAGRAYVVVAAADAHVVERLGAMIVSSADLAYIFAVLEDVRPTVVVDSDCSIEAVGAAVEDDGMQQAIHVTDSSALAEYACRHNH